MCFKLSPLGSKLSLQKNVRSGKLRTMQKRQSETFESNLSKLPIEYAALNSNAMLLYKNVGSTHTAVHQDYSYRTSSTSRISNWHCKQEHMHRSAAHCCLCQLTGWKIVTGCLPACPSVCLSLTHARTPRLLTRLFGGKPTSHQFLLCVRCILYVLWFSVVFFYFFCRML